MDTNPWLRLPTNPPYVLPEDREAVEEFNRARGQAHDHFLHINELLPEPFIGDKDAPVVLLSNNPGFGENVPFRQTSDFRAMMRNNLHHVATDWPFLYLNPAFDVWEKWWRRKRVRRLIKRFDKQTVARCILNVVLCPYPSRNYGHLSVPSVRYSFGLVSDAVARNSVVILMRLGQRGEWAENVPELRNYDRFFLVPNARNPAVTENCPGYEQVISAIKAFTNDQQGNEVRQ